MALRYESARGLLARKEEVGGAMMWKKLGQTTRSFPRTRRHLLRPCQASRCSSIGCRRLPRGTMSSMMVGGRIVDGARVFDDGGIDSGGDRQEAYDAEYNILPPPQEEGAGYAEEAHYAE